MEQINWFNLVWCLLGTIPLLAIAKLTNKVDPWWYIWFYLLVMAAAVFICLEFVMK